MRQARGDLGAVERARLASEGRFVGDAFVRGQLFDLGSYPGLVVDADGASYNNKIIPVPFSMTPGEIVMGELWEVGSPDHVFQWLDTYEGITPDGSADEYERVFLSTCFGTKKYVNSHAYVYRASLQNVQKIKSGRWAI